MIPFNEDNVSEQMCVEMAHQADASKASLRISIESTDAVIKSLINENL